MRGSWKHFEKHVLTQKLHHNEDGSSLAQQKVQKMTLFDSQLEQQWDVLFDIQNVELSQQGALLGVQLVSVQSLLPQVEVAHLNLALCFLKLVKIDGVQRNIVHCPAHAVHVMLQVAHPIQALECALWQETDAHQIAVNQVHLTVDVMVKVSTVLLVLALILASRQQPVVKLLLCISSVVKFLVECTALAQHISSC